jgi:hypothetical protein
MGEDLSSFVPQVCRLSKLQEEVDKEENARLELEELSAGRISDLSSTSRLQESETPANEDTDITTDGSEVQTRIQQDDRDDEESAFDYDLNPLDPMLTPIKRAEMMC